MKACLDGKKVDDIEAWEEKGAQLEDLLEAKFYKQRSYEGHENPQAMMEAADYTDEWFAEEGRTFRVYYVCLVGGNEWPCGTLILSDNWDRFHTDPLANKQRWYCNVCGAKYMTRFGVLCEMSHKKSNIVGYCLAGHPPFEFKDVKTMAIQERVKDMKTPQELYKALPKASFLDRVPEAYEGRGHLPL